MAEYSRPGIAVLASGSGSTMEAFVHASQDGIVDAEIHVVISDKPCEGSFERVNRLNKLYGLEIRAVEANRMLYPGGEQERGQTLEESEVICRVISDAQCSLVVLMGYMRIVAPEGDLMKEYGWHPDYSMMETDNSPHGILEARMLNTHPGILPETTDTYGIHTQSRVLELGLDTTAHTVHAVSAGVDKGPIFTEHEVPVFSDDDPQTLFDRVQRIEKAYLPIDIDKFIKLRQEMEQA